MVRASKKAFQITWHLSHLFTSVSQRSAIVDQGMAVLAFLLELAQLSEPLRSCDCEE